MWYDAQGRMIANFEPNTTPNYNDDTLVTYAVATAAMTGWRYVYNMGRRPGRQPATPAGAASTSSTTEPAGS